MNRDKELYKQLRALPWAELWSAEVARFNSASPKERLERVAVIRAAGVVFAEAGSHEQFDEVKLWLRALLSDPDEKIRRYAMGALPKIGADDHDEQELLALAKRATSSREREYISEALAKIGGKETLRHAEALPPRTIQRIQASVLRNEISSRIRLDVPLNDFQGFEIRLRGRAGLEGFVREEVESLAKRKFKVVGSNSGLVRLTAIAPFSLGDIYAMRCFGTLSFAIGAAQGDSASALAKLATSESAQRILQALTEGPIRYRLDFVNKGHQRAAVRELAQRIYSIRPEMINGGGDTPWTIEIHSDRQENRLELSPKIIPDPRFAYRRRDVPAASHPPLAACMARLAGRIEGDIVWDPFCGSGLELIERCLLGRVRKVFGTDLSQAAIEITRENFSSARIEGIETNFVCMDFRDFDPSVVTLIITNPPMGKRVPIPNLRRLIEDLFETASRALAPGGRLVFANPLRLAPKDRSLKLEFAQIVDFGGFNCRLEKYVKLGRALAIRQ